MTSGSRKDWKENWHEDVFAYDDYHAAQDGTVGMDNPPGDVPYLFAEAVGQFNYTARKGFTSYYRRAGEPMAQMQQAIRHAQAHNKAAANPKICGVVAWCGFEYSSLVNEYKRVKYPGVADVFRIPKLGASFYLAQVSPRVRPVILPNFYWDFSPQTPRGPGKEAAIFSNCDRLEVFIDGVRKAALLPDSKIYSHVKYPPFFLDLDLEGAGHPELRIDGYVGDKLALSRSFSPDAAHDQFMMEADDHELAGDGADATRVVFRVTDRYGAPRAFAGGEVRFDLTGPGTLVGDNPFLLAESGGAGAVWIRTVSRGTGRIVLKARHSQLGEKAVEVTVKAG
jgi:beta-galactosidase